MIRWLGSVIMRRHGSSQGQGGGGGGGGGISDAWLWAAGGTDYILWAAGGTDVILLESAGGAGAGAAMGLLLSLTYAS